MIKENASYAYLFQLLFSFRILTLEMLRSEHLSELIQYLISIDRQSTNINLHHLPFLIKANNILIIHYHSLRLASMSLHKSKWRLDSPIDFDAWGVKQLLQIDLHKSCSNESFVQNQPECLKSRIQRPHVLNSVNIQGYRNQSVFS